MRKLIVLLLLTHPVLAAEKWKGDQYPHPVTVGGLGGLAFDSGNFAVMGTLAGRIIPDGFISDIRDQVFLETMAGPVFGGGAILSIHLRWDFRMDDSWRFYGIGGLGGDSSGGGKSFSIRPRFGAGAFRALSPKVDLRAELAADLFSFGISIGI